MASVRIIHPLIIAFLLIAGPIGMQLQGYERIQRSQEPPTKADWIQQISPLLWEWRAFHPHDPTWVKPDLVEFPIPPGGVLFSNTSAPGVGRVVYHQTSGIFRGCMTHTGAATPKGFVLLSARSGRILWWSLGRDGARVRRVASGQHMSGPFLENMANSITMLRVPKHNKRGKICFLFLWLDRNESISSLLWQWRGIEIQAGNLHKKLERVPYRTRSIVFQVSCIPRDRSFVYNATGALCGCMTHNGALTYNGFYSNQFGRNTTGDQVSVGYERDGGQRLF
ncbi:hypothetical protein BDN71DRAFT_1434458 [Pleurotus eryngii]|uniref:Uncharacterized protein n=1 Tax=Pleurotus eryngii TaxID=5323 RepID=A0A9P5ZPE7_PLEER|nr:hypothetical protein BDN71DRAFT_1434458 [Pleurotus eryngii]